MNYKILRREGSEADKQALLEKLRQDKAPPTLIERLGMWWERLWPQARIPAYATGFAMALAAVTAGGVFYTQAPIAAPEIDDLEFGGTSAVVIESTTDPATLIWITDADEDQDEEDALDESPEEGEEF